eukprot:7175763-Karenia_brevis.AAC.1
MMMRMGVLTTIMMMMMMTMVQRIQNESTSRICFCEGVSRSCAACRRPGWATAQQWMMMMVM